MKNDFFVVHLCPPGTELPEGKLEMDELPKHGVQHGPSSGAGRRRKAATKKKATKSKASKSKQSGKGPTAKANSPTLISPSLNPAAPPKTEVPGLPEDSATGVAAPLVKSESEHSMQVESQEGALDEGIAAVAGADAPLVKAEAAAMEVDTEPATLLHLRYEEPAAKKVKTEDGAVPVKDEASGDAQVKQEISTEGAEKIKFAGELEVNDVLNAYLTSGPVPDTNLMDDTKDPDGLTSTPYVDSRHTFLEMCQWRHYQFDTLRRAKHASLMSLYHLHNNNEESNRAHAAHCAECGKQIKGVRWHCSVCPDFELCKNCNTHDPNNPTLHPHLLTPYRVSYEGELRA